MRTLKYLFLLTAFVTLGFTSCTKEDQVKDETENPTEVTPETGVSNPLMDNISSRSDGTLDLGCFTIDFPFSLEVDDETIEVNDIDAFEVVIESLTEASFVDFVYPLDITYEDGSTESLASGEELGLAFVSCLPDDGWSVDSTYTGEALFPAFLINSEEYCFDFVYPVDLTDVDGNSSSASSEDELVELLAVADGLLFFDFPFNVVDEDDEITVLEDGDALFEMLLSCDEGGFGGGFDTTVTYGGEIGCYGVEYPFSVVMADGSIVEVNNHDEFCVLMLEGDFVDFVYPLTLIDVDGEALVVNSEEELQDALEDCWDGGVTIDPGFLIFLEAASFDCYSPNYPINVLVGDEVVPVNCLDEAFELLESLGDELPQLQYPFSVTIIASGETVEIADFEGLIEVISDCE